jgi:hypothetical protein
MSFEPIDHVILLSSRDSAALRGIEPALEKVLPAQSVCGRSGFVAGNFQKSRGAFENAIEFAAIEPHASAARALVDLDAVGCLGLHRAIAHRTEDYSGTHFQFLLSMDWKLKVIRFGRHAPYVKKTKRFLIAG